MRRCRMFRLPQQLDRLLDAFVVAVMEPLAHAKLLPQRRGPGAAAGSDEVALWFS